jgi:DNA polymerase-3 subunit epsilon
MDFITIDFETATKDRDSPCEIGLTFVKNREIVETKSWLIKPRYSQFDFFNTLIHGIAPEHVADKPEFNELWVEIKPLIENQLLIAHNAAFDISVLRKTLDAYQISYPKLTYACSYIFSKKVWTGLSGYDLKTLCSVNKIDLKHHRAGNDSRATAELAIKAFELKEVTSVNDFYKKLNIITGELYDGGYRPSETRRKEDIYFSESTTTEQTDKKITGDPTKHNPESLFYGKTVVFTGVLSSMPRTLAQQIILDIGGKIGNGVTKDTDYLVVGHQDYRIVGEDGMSGKQEKAIKLIEKGSALEVISEDAFMKNI